VTSEEYGNKIIKMLMTIPDDLDSALICKMVQEFLE